MPFPLFELPAELRLKIYSYALAPTGVLSLSSSPTRRNAVDPPIALALLRANRQIRHEAQDILYEENAACLAIDCHDTTWPIISERRLPERTLRRLQHLTLVCDCTARFSAAYADVDFAPLEALTALRTLRVCSVGPGVDSPTPEPMAAAVYLLTEILARVPASVRLSFGADAASGATKQESDFVSRLVDVRAGMQRTQVVSYGSAVLEEVSHGVPADERGSKCGQTTNVYYDDRLDWIYGNRRFQTGGEFAI